MNVRNLLITVLTIVLIGAVLLGVGSMTNAGVVAEPKADVMRSGLANVRAYAPAAAAGSDAYAVDSGLLFRQQGNAWQLVETPESVIVNDVVTSATTPDLVYAAAANELAVYRSTNAGASWMRVPLSTEYVGGVTSLALDEDQRILYAGADTAGIFRLRDVGSSMILSGHSHMDAPVIDMAAAGDGSGLALARTADTLYRADNFGLTWTAVENLGSTPTALAVGHTNPAVFYVGTVDRGLLKSADGSDWTLANAGLGFVPGSRLQIDALAVDPQQPDVLYAATSYLFGSTTVHQTPVAVNMSTDGAAVWAPLETLDGGVAVAELLPLAGQTGAAYALMSNSRAPLAMGAAPEMAIAELAFTPVEAEPAAVAAVNWTGILSWLTAGLAALALLAVLASDLGKRQPSMGRRLTPELAQKM
jgi:photosystem II stability/assembly factor-like uncharacterized protein